MSLEMLVAAVELTPPEQPPAVSVEGRPPSAVLVPIYDTPDGPEILLTRRAWHLRSHTGEVSFPGGRMDDQDPDLTWTALREAHEEVALHPDAVEVIGELDRMSTVSSPANIVPVVGLLKGRPTDLVASPGEVDAILHLSVRELLDPTIYREEIWAREGGEIEITFFELVEDTLWGATARMVRSLFEKL